MSDFGYRYPELPQNELILSNGLMAWYDFVTDTTYAVTIGAIIGGVNPDTVWNPSFEYSEGQVVSYLGKIWIATSEPGNLGQPPSDVSIYWTEEPDPVVPGNFWPLEGTADLAGGGTLIRGGGDKYIQLGTPGDFGDQGIAGMFIFAQYLPNDANIDVNIVPDQAIEHQIYSGVNDYMYHFGFGPSNGYMRLYAQSGADDAEVRLIPGGALQYVEYQDSVLDVTPLALANAGWVQGQLGNYWALGGASDLTSSVFIRAGNNKSIGFGNGGPNQRFTSFSIYTNGGDPDLDGNIQVSGTGVSLQSFEQVDPFNVSGSDFQLFANNPDYGWRLSSSDSLGIAHEYTLQYNNPDPLLEFRLNQPDDNSIIPMTRHTLVVESPTVAAIGFGLSDLYSLQNDNVVPEVVPVGSTSWAWTDPTDGAEDVQYKMRGISAGALTDFMTIHGGIDSQFQVHGPLKLFEDATPPSAASHEGALIWTGTEIQFSDGATWSALGGGSGWPLSGDADLTGSVGIKGDSLGTFEVIIGDDVAGSGGFEIKSFRVKAYDPNEMDGAGRFYVNTYGFAGQYEYTDGSYAWVAASGPIGLQSSQLNVYDFATNSAANVICEPTEITLDRTVLTATNGAVNDFINYTMRGLSATDGFGMRVNFEMPNSINAQVSFFEEVSWEDSATTSEDHKYELRGYSGGSMTNFFTIRGGTDKQAEVYGPLKNASYTVAGVPSAASHTGAMIYVTDETGGAVPAFSDGTNWRRVTDRAIIS